MALTSVRQLFLLSALITSTLLGSSRIAAAEDTTKVLDLNQVDLEEVDDNWDNQSQVPKLNPDSGLKVKDIIEPTAEYTYASFGKADPFAVPSFLGPKAKETSAAGVVEGVGEPTFGSKVITVTSPLQAYPLPALIVKGIWQTADREFRAVVITPKKEGVVVKIGDPISSGKILDIDKEGLLVRLYKLRKDGVREYEDSRMSFGTGLKLAKTSIKLEPGKEAQFPMMEEPATPGKIPQGAAAPATPGAGAAGTDPALAPPPGFKNPDLKNAAGAPGADAPSAQETKPAAANAVALPAAAIQALKSPPGLTPASDKTSTRPGSSTK